MLFIDALSIYGSIIAIVWFLFHELEVLARKEYVNIIANVLLKKPSGMFLRSNLIGLIDIIDDALTPKKWHFIYLPSIKRTIIFLLPLYVLFPLIFYYQYKSVLLTIYVFIIVLFSNIFIDYVSISKSISINKRVKSSKSLCISTVYILSDFVLSVVFSIVPIILSMTLIEFSPGISNKWLVDITLNSQVQEKHTLSKRMEEGINIAKIFIEDQENSGRIFSNEEKQNIVIDAVGYYTGRAIAAERDIDMMVIFIRCGVISFLTNIIFFMVIFLYFISLFVFKLMMAFSTSLIEIDKYMFVSESPLSAISYIIIIVFSSIFWSLYVVV